MKRYAVVAAVAFALVNGATSRVDAQFVSAFDRTPDRVWAGPAYWTNPLQDWRVAAGALECTATGPSRSIVLLTRNLSDRPAPFTMTMTLAPWQAPTDKAATAWIGFRIAARGRFGDHRDDAVYGKGIESGLRADTSLVDAGTFAVALASFGIITFTKADPTFIILAAGIIGAIFF